MMLYSRSSTSTVPAVRSDCSGSCKSVPNVVSENRTWMKWDRPRWINQSIDQSINQSINQSNHIKSSVCKAPLKQSSQRRLLWVGLHKEPSLKAQLELFASSWNCWRRNFYGPDALSVTKQTASKHWRIYVIIVKKAQNSATVNQWRHEPVWNRSNSPLHFDVFRAVIQSDNLTAPVTEFLPNLLNLKTLFKISLTELYRCRNAAK